MKLCHFGHSVARSLDRNSRRLALGVVGLSLPMALAGSARAQVGGDFKWEESIARTPEDVALHPRGGGWAVVRSAQAVLGGGAPSVHPDELVVIGTADGHRLIPVAGSCTTWGLTLTEGASDLIAPGLTCAVLVGQRHYQGMNSSHVNVIALGGAYGGNGKCLGNYAIPNAGYVNDIALAPDERFAVLNHRNWVHVFDLVTLDAQGNLPPAAVGAFPVANTGAGQWTEPTWQRDSIAMTRSTTANAPIRAVVTTTRQDLPAPTAQVAVVDLTGAAPVLVLDPLLHPQALLQDPANPGIAHAPHDLAITPNDNRAVVTGTDVVALIDLTQPTPTVSKVFTVGIQREYGTLADSVLLTDTHALVVGNYAGLVGWQADVYEIASGSLVHKTTFTGTGQVHDVDKGAENDRFVLRTTDHVVVLGDLAATPIPRVDVASQSLPLAYSGTTSVFDSVIVSRRWTVNIAPPPGFSLVPRQFAVAVAAELNPPSGVPAVRVDIIDLTWTSSAPSIVLSELFSDVNQAGVKPGAVQLIPGGQGVVVRTTAAPHDVNPNTDPNAPSGEDTWILSLLDPQPGVGPLGAVFQYEGQGFAQGGADALDIGWTPAVSVTHRVDSFGNELGYIHTILIDR